MNTQADNSSELGRSLEPTNPLTGRGQADDDETPPPLPEGWKAFYRGKYWWATPPWNPWRVKDRFGRLAWDLEATVTAQTPEELLREITEQQELYANLMEREGNGVA